MTGLEVQEVTVSRGAGPVITAVDLTVNRGKITAVVGPNGAGKTSLLESISGIIKPSAGTIMLEGDSVEHFSRVKRVRRGLLHIEQGRTVFTTLTVSENLALTAQNDDDAAEALALFPELDKRRSSLAGLLSGGEQQMLVLARAFAARPKYLLIDEMSLGLAPVVFRRLLPAIADFAERGTGVLLVEQFTEHALNIASEALVVSGGRVTYQGLAARLAESPELLHRAYLGGGTDAE